MNNIYDIEVKKIDGTVQSMAEYKGKVLLIVNTASRCGLTPQYEGLEKLYKSYKDAGFYVLGFPSNQFLQQEPGTENEIHDFCQLTYDVTFPMFSKINVNGADTHPLYQLLKKKAKGFLGSGDIKWNFTKFLIDRDGNIVKRYAPFTKPEDIESDIRKLTEK